MAGGARGWVVGRAGFGVLLLPGFGVSSSSPQVPGHPTSTCNAGVNYILYIESTPDVRHPRDSFVIHYIGRVCNSRRRGGGYEYIIPGYYCTILLQLCTYGEQRRFKHTTRRLKIINNLVAKPTLFRYFGIVKAYFTASLYRDQP